MACHDDEVVAAPVVPTLDEVCRVGRAAGLDEVGVCTASAFVEARRVLEERKASGLHATMAFTYRRPERSTDPAHTVDAAASLVVGARAYRHAEPAPPPSNDPVGRVAAYARDDHYAELRRALEQVATRLRADGWRARVLVDDNALVDRAAAMRAGLGWQGKSGNVLLVGRGSWFVLGAVVTDAPLAAADPPLVDDLCGPCRRCVDACPTSAIVARGVVDARRCLSWLLQDAGVFPREHRVALGDRIYGCDACQEVCPPNHRADRAAGRDADADARGDAGGDAGAGAWVPLLELLAATDDEVLARYGRWYINRREPRWVRRNALVVLGNVGDGADRRVAATLDAYLRHPDPVLRAHAVWAAARLGRRDSLAVVADDDAAEVRDELAALAAGDANGATATAGIEPS
jgi:epoxyqueuosine reductase